MGEMLCLWLGGLGVVTALGALAWSVRRMDDIWYSRRAAAAPVLLGAVILLVVSLGVLLGFSPLFQRLAG